VDDLLSEKEQIEQIRSWWSEYGGYVIGGLGLGIALLVGWNFYQNSILEAQLEGSAMFEEVAVHVSTGNLEGAETVVADLSANYGETIYAAQAQFALARLYMDKNRDQDAADALQKVLDGSSGNALKHVARTRLARILLYQGNAQGVLDLLEGQQSDAFAATWNELRGDAHHELGQVAEAAAAYQAALLDPMAQVTIDQQLVQWKVLDLPEIVAPDAAETVAEEVVAEEPPAADEVEGSGDEEGE
jgi:predicted negative regulator of RcsB-dependent stress response